MESLSYGQILVKSGLLSMEEAVRKLHTPLPKDGQWGIIPQRGVEATPCGQISQLEVHQLLATSPQVIYPIGLNGQDEPVITSLPEPLASGMSPTVGKPIYLGIDIPSPPMEEMDQKILPLGKVSTIIVASPHKSPQNWKAA